MWTEKGSNIGRFKENKDFFFPLSISIFVFSLYFFGDNCPQTQLHISMSSVGESRLNHARREHGCCAPSFMDGLKQSVGEAWSQL